MYIKINRNVCDHQLAICERCLGKFLANPMGYERQCFEEIREDGSELLTIDLHTGDHDVRLVLDEAQRKMMAGEGWATFMDFAVPMYRNTTEKPE
ncbi:MAG: hypothetical protein KJ065_23165 [Anaerolineae bacterium]|nr:hypothetical protein [Anaerolineae bacterium]